MNAGPAAAARAGRGRGRVRRRRHLRRGARAAGHDGLGRRPDRPAPAGRADRVGLPARLRRDAAADRPDRRPARPGAGAGRRAGGVRRRLAGHRRWPTTCPAWSLGRFLQGVGGGGLVPATLALVADLYPVDRRGVPLGVVSAVQELGSVLGPLFGALVLAVADWRVIFAINLVVGLVLAVAHPPARPRRVPAAARPATRVHRRLGRSGARCCVALRSPAALVFAPADLAGHRRDLGAAVRPGRRLGRWLTPLGLVAIGRRAAVPGPLLTARRPLVDLRGWWAAAREADLPGALLLAAALAGVILAFATADPRVQVFSPAGPWYLLAAAVAAGGVRLAPAHRRGPAGPARRAAAYAGLGRAAGQLLRRRGPDRRPDRHPDLRPHHRLPRLPAAGRAGAGPVPGRAAGRRRRRRLPHPHLPAGVVTAAGMVLAAVGFVLMSRWDLTSLSSWPATLPLCSAASASASRSRRSTPPCSPRPTTTCTAWPAPAWSSPGWSACSSASRR